MRKRLGRLGLVLMLFVIFMLLGALVSVQFPEKIALLTMLVWTFAVGGGLFVAYEGDD